MGQKAFSLSVVLQIVFFICSSVVSAIPRPQTPVPSTGPTSSYWLSSIQRQGTVAYGSNAANYPIFRNVKDYGATGDGSTDDTDAINNAISDGNRCGEGCDSSTTTPAIVYFPPGTYVVSQPIIQYYYTQLIGDAITIPTIQAASSFQGIAVIDSDPYLPGGANWYTNQNNFYRQIRNFVIDLTSMPISAGAGIHWQVAQATSLQNIVFNMIQGGGSSNKQQGIFMDNGSGGFMSDLVFNGGLYGAFFGNQQFTSRNLTFNNCQTAIYMNWNWLWTLKSMNINNCGIGIDMSGLSNNVNQTVGSIILIDSTFSGTPIGVKTAFNANSQPDTAGTLIIDNVDFTGTQSAVAAADGSQILAGGSVIQSWAQGNAYQPQAAVGARNVKRTPQAGGPSFMTDVCSGSSVPTSLGASSGWAAQSSTETSPVSTSTALVSTFPISSSSPTGSSSAPSAVGTSPSTTTTFPSGTSASTCSASASPVSMQRIQQSLSAPSMAAELLSGNKIFERGKPQYQDVPVSSFVSVKSNGAKGDGVTDDTAAIQSIFDSATADQIVYFDHGAYVITSTVKVPANIRITGEIWPLIMAQGTSFNDQTNPQPVFQIGQPGDQGSVEMSDLIFEVLGPAPGAILVEWNVAESSQGSCAMWDVHFRIGGSAGTLLQGDTCANTTDSGTFNPSCAGSFLMMHITEEATAYLENVWLWVADHELDLSSHPETNIYNGRGLLIESKGPTWLYGTSSEHSQLYNYQVSNAQNLFMGAIQTETPYMQASPNALNGGFTPNAAYSDPDFSNCNSTTGSCIKAWGLRVVDSSDIFTFGAGLYSFFDDYDQTCLETESCQENMVDLECSSGVYLYGLSTKAATNMVTVNGQSEALQADNANGFCQTIALFEQE